MGITYNKFLRLENEISVKKIQQSLEHYHFDIKNKHRVVDNVLGYFMGCVRKGGYVSGEYEKFLREQEQEIKRKVRIDKENLQIKMSQKYLHQIAQKVAPICERYTKESYTKWRTENPQVQEDVTRFLSRFKDCTQTSIESITKSRYVKYEETVETTGYEEWKDKNREMLNKLYFSKVKKEGMVKYQDVRELYLAWKIDPHRTKHICENALESSV